MATPALTLTEVNSMWEGHEIAVLRFHHDHPGERHPDAATDEYQRALTKLCARGMVEVSDTGSPPKIVRVDERGVTLLTFGSLVIPEIVP